MSQGNEEDRDPLELLAAEFIERQRGGEHPPISEYVAQYPELAAEIQDLFPTIAAMEQLKEQRQGSRSGCVSLGAARLERLGDFRILGEIGRGGMGIVYEAFQESLGRHVAVKVLPRQALLDAKQLRRFQREAQTAARLHHTNIVPLFGVGEQDGFHYLVMQLIRGVGLDAVLAQLQRSCLGTAANEANDDGSPPAEARSAGEASRLAQGLVEGQFWQAGEFSLSSADVGRGAVPVVSGSASGDTSSSSSSCAVTEDFRGGTDPTPPVAGTGEAVAISPVAPPLEAGHLGAAYWRSVAVIGMQVADALHYAHVHHTLHRDIKPANLLLDSQGVVWITDFGLAKTMDEDHGSQTGALAGTLRYMAPEQFSGQSDPRSDVYSLGLTLYELLTLQPAFADTSRSNLIRKIAHEAPLRLRKHNSRIPGDLETIVLKATARDPGDRYQTAAELARDLERYLEDRPIRARRTTVVERLWRWSRRNRAVASLAAISLTLLVLVAVVASFGYARTRQANIQEARQREKAEATSALALEALDKIFLEFAPDRTASASALGVVSDAGEEITVTVQPVLSKEAASLLEHMLVFYDRLAQQGGSDARLLRKVAEANRRVGDIRQRLGHQDQARAAYTRALEVYRQLAEAAPQEADLAVEIAKIHNELGNVCGATEQWEAGRAAYSQALAILSAIPASQASPQQQYELARTYYFMARLAPREPMPFFGPQGPRRGPHGPGPGAGPGPEGGRLALGPRELGGRGPRRNPAGLGKLADRPPPDRIASDRPPTEHRPRDERPPFDRSPAGRPDRQPPGGPPRDANRGAREEDLRKAIELLDALVAQHPAVPDYRYLLARCYREIPPWFGRGRDTTTPATNKAVTILQQLVKDFPDVPDYRYDLCESYAMFPLRGPFGPDGPDKTASQRWRESLQKALEISEALVAEHPNVPDYAVSQVRIRLGLAMLLQETDSAAAETGLRKALDLQSSLARRFPNTVSFKVWQAIVGDSLARVLENAGRQTEARPIRQAAVSVLQDVAKGDPNAWHVRGMLAYNYMGLANLLRRLGDESAAAEAFRQAEALRPEGPANRKEDGPETKGRG